MRIIKRSIILAVLVLSLLACQSLEVLPEPGPDDGQPNNGNLPRVTGFDCVPQNTLRQYAQLVRVIDGDTIEVEMDGEQYRVRYIGVDTPERDEPFYSEASEANQAYLSGEYLLLVKDVSETDRYGRLLRYVFAGEDRFVNYELVREGYATSLTYPPDVACADFFLDAQIEARDQGRGFWEESLNSLDPLESSTQPDSVVIDMIHYDGQASPVETDEFILIKNVGAAPVDITGWTINAGAPGQDFTFPSFSLQPEQSCRIYTNEIHLEWCGFSFGLDESIWSNQGDCGYLSDSQGTLVDALCYQ